jgi:hypothetical protein
MHLFFKKLSFTVFLALFISVSSAQAFDLANGLMYAVPSPNGTPATDGSDNGWDLSAAEPIWQSNQLAKELHGTLALNYDENNLYVYAKIHLANDKMYNNNGPAGPFWVGDEVELRLCSDPSLGYPLSNANPVDHTSKQVCHISFWKDTKDDKDYIHIAYGGMHGGGQGEAYNPPGSKIVFTQLDHEYVMQVVLPWSALNVPDGKNPFKPGSRMTAIFGLHWHVGTWFYAVNAVYSTSPGDFAFMQWQDWGQVEFSPTGNLKPHHETMEQALASSVPEQVGVPITVNVPDEGKLSINIVGDKGEVVREVVGGQPVKAGPYTAYWDGRDQWGFAQTPGKFHWRAYFSHGLKARLVGFVGSSGTPPWPTDDGKGGWGGDHGVPTSASADDTGLYFGWEGSEAQRQIVKVGYDGTTLWRATPFVRGGFSDLRALASNGKYVFAIYDGTHPALSRLDAATGQTVLFGQEMGKGSAVPVVPPPAGAAPAAAAPLNLIKPPDNSLPAEGGVLGMGRTPSPVDGLEPECIGLAATATEVFAPLYSQNKIQVLDPETGAPIRSLDCPRPRGVALDAQGNLYAVSFGTDAPAQIVRFDGAQGAAKPVVTAGLVAPVGVAVAASGQICVTDEGPSQQIKIFSADGKLANSLGKEGGRPWAGTYDPTSYRDPSAIVADKQGGLVVAESSIPKIFDRIDLASGKTLARWFGAPGYGVENVADPVDPMTNYYPFEPEGFARATVPGEGKVGMPDAYWVPSKAGMDGVGSLFGEGFPSISILSNGKKYFVDDANPHAVCVIDGDTIKPVGHLDVYNTHDRRLPDTKQPFIQMWIDRNGDNKMEPDEVTTIDTVDNQPMPGLSQGSGTMWIDHTGNAYLITGANSIIKIPATGFADNGAILWDPSKATYAVPALLPSKLKGLGTSPRSGPVGVRVDSAGNLYTCITTTVPALTPALATKIQATFPGIPQSQWCAYADENLAKSMHEGLGHTAESNMVKFAKYGPDGKMLWVAGRKATAAPGPGEMYHTWSMNDLVGDDYVSMCSEWGLIYFYTHDGFYVDALMNDPNALPPAGPYTFGSENFSGRVQAFPKLGKVYAYDQGGVYAVDGFGPDLKVAGEQRFKGLVTLDKVYGGVSQAAIAASLQIVPVSGDIAQDSTWSPAPTVTIMSATGTPMATAQVGYDNDNLYAKVHVVDDTPLQNVGSDPSVVFKSGDVVGLDLGPGLPANRGKPVLGDLRILAAKMQGQDHLIGMKPISKQAKQPQQYTTPASGTKSFDFVGEIPGGKVVLTADADGKGYTALFTVPKSFLEFTLAPGTPVKGDVEVLLSGVKSQGVQAVSRNWLYSGGQVQTTMVDDIPTEAWLYPQFWGDITVK